MLTIAIIWKQQQQTKEIKKNKACWFMFFNRFFFTKKRYQKTEKERGNFFPMKSISLLGILKLTKKNKQRKNLRKYKNDEWE